MDGTELPGRTITASVAGIIKSTHGLCWRDGKEEYNAFANWKKVHLLNSGSWKNVLSKIKNRQVL